MVIKKITSILSLNFSIVSSLIKIWRAMPSTIPECQQIKIGERSADKYYYAYL